MCNRDVKFGAFYDFAREHGADFIATGHYARVEDGEFLRGVDAGKDQSYFLWAIAPAALAMARFPLGGMEKTAVRALAERFDLPNARKKDSQGICFLGPVSMDDFLRAELPTEAGPALDESGTRIGTHDGVLLHTLGERVALRDAETGPWYVVAKDIRANALVVSKSREKAIRMDSIALHETNWFAEVMPGEELTAQYRYHGPLIAGTLNGNTFTPAHAIEEPIASGQSLVIYRDERVIGGGIIG